MRTKSLKRRASVRRSMLLLATLAMTFATLFSVGVNTAPADAGGRTCTGFTSKSMQHAKSLYWIQCGQRWSSSSGQHKCTWQSSGWKCSGPKTHNNNCHSLYQANSITTAKARYRHICGQSWNASSGVHKCNYWSQHNRWTCSGPSSR